MGTMISKPEVEPESEPNWGLAEFETKEEKILHTISNVTSQCDTCLSKAKNIKEPRAAQYLCYECQMYLCNKCFKKVKRHKGRENHNFVKLGSYENETEPEIDTLLDGLMHEADSWDYVKSEAIDVCDKVNVKHSLDTHNSAIYGICGFEKTWIACDYNNSCLKVFQFDSNDLDRYIKIWSKPWDATDIKVKVKPTELRELSIASNAASVTTDEEQEVDRSMLAVTLPRVSRIIILDLNEVPAVKHSIIEVPKRCFCISYLDGKILTANFEVEGLKCCIYTLSTDGIILNIISTEMYPNFPQTAPGVRRVLEFCSSNMKNRWYDNFKTTNDCTCKLSIVSEQPGIWAVGVNLDSKEIVLGTSKNILEVTSGFIGDEVREMVMQSIGIPSSVCGYKGKTFVSHRLKRSRKNIVTILRST